MWRLAPLQYASHRGLFVLSQVPVAYPVCECLSVMCSTNQLPVTCISDAVFEEEKSSLFDGQSVLLPCRHILSALPKSLKQASKINSVLYKHSKNMNMKICVNNSLARKYSISKGWVFFCQCSHSCPSGWVAIRCVSPWET